MSPSSVTNAAELAIASLKAVHSSDQLQSRAAIRTHLGFTYGEQIHSLGTCRYVRAVHDKVGKVATSRDASAFNSSSLRVIAREWNLSRGGNRRIGESCAKACCRSECGKSILSAPAQLETLFLSFRATDLVDRNHSRPNRAHDRP